MTDLTTNYKLKLTQFNRRGWQDEYYANMRIVDSALSTIMTVAQFVGVWENQQAYTIGQKVTDGDNSIIYECLVNHTSSASPTTFFEERTANPTYWTAWSLPARSRGAWVAGTAYAMGDFVSDASSGKYAVCIVSHTASSNFLTDISAGYWDVLATITPVTLSNVAPQAVGSVASAGVGGLAARDDHVHALAATLTTTEGVQGGGNVIANLTIKLDVNNLTTDTAPALTDPIAYYKVASTAHRKMSLQSLWNTVNSLTAYTTLNIADEIPVRDGSGSGNGVRKITAQNFFNGINVLTALTAPVAADKITIYDTTGSAAKTITFDNLLKNINNSTQDTAPDSNADFVSTYDTSATAVKKAAIARFSTMPRSYLAGLGLANNGSDATNDIDIAVGQCRGVNNDCDIVLASALTKQLDAVWAVGNNAGGRATGAAIANGTYFVFVIRRPDTGVVDVAFDSSVTGANIAANTNVNYTQIRRIGCILRESASIVAFSQVDDEFIRKTGVRDVNANNPGTSAVTRTLSVPTGVQVLAKFNATLNNNAGAGTSYAYFSELDKNDEAPNISATPGAMLGPSANVSGQLIVCVGQFVVRTNASAQVRSRISYSDANVTLYMQTLGWIDRRGRDD